MEAQTLSVTASPSVTILSNYSYYPAHHDAYPFAAYGQQLEEYSPKLDDLLQDDGDQAAGHDQQDQELSPGFADLSLEDGGSVGGHDQQDEEPYPGFDDLSVDNFVPFVKDIMGREDRRQPAVATLLTGVMYKVSVTKDLYRHMLSLSGAEEIQLMLDALQCVSQSPSTGFPVVSVLMPISVTGPDFYALGYGLPIGGRGGITKALDRLSGRNGGSFPTSLTLQEVELLEEGPLACGAFGDVYKAKSRNRIVALKVFRMIGTYKTEDMKKLFEVRDCYLLSPSRLSN